MPPAALPHLRRDMNSCSNHTNKAVTKMILLEDNLKMQLRCDSVLAAAHQVCICILNQCRCGHCSKLQVLASCLGREQWGASAH